VGFLDRLSKPSKPARKDPADRQKRAGAREYEAQRHDREAARLEELGDTAGAQAQRELAAGLRDPRPRR
jgi:hypothetical protein